MVVREERETYSNISRCLLFTWAEPHPIPPPPPRQRIYKMDHEVVLNVTLEAKGFNYYVASYRGRPLVSSPTRDPVNESLKALCRMGLSDGEVVFTREDDGEVLFRIDSLFDWALVQENAP